MNPFNKAKHVQTIGANSFSWQSSFESTLYHLISSFEGTLYHFRNWQLERFTKLVLVVKCQHIVPFEGSLTRSRFKIDLQRDKNMEMNQVFENIWEDS